MAIIVGGVDVIHVKVGFEKLLGQYRLLIDHNGYLTSLKKMNAPYLKDIVIMNADRFERSPKQAGCLLHWQRDSFKNP